MSGPAKPRLFYGWRMAGAAFLLQGMQAAFLIQSFGAYAAVFRDSFGWSKTALAGGAAVQQMESALLGPIVGWMIDRFGARAMVRIGVVMFAAGLMLLSAVESLTSFYLAFVVLAVGMSMGGHLPMSVAVMHWFERYRARALSLLTLGFAVGGFVVPVIAWSFAKYGWRETAFGCGVVMLVAGLPLANMIRNRPRDMGEVIDGEAVARVVQSSAATRGAPVTIVDEDDTRDFTVREALRTRAFWLVTLGFAFAMFMVGSVSVHAIIHMKEGLNYTVEEAALVIGVQTAAQVIGIMLGWAIEKRWEKRLVAAGCMIGHMSALLLLAFASSYAMLVFFAILNGTAWGLRGPFIQAMRPDYFGREAIATIIGISSLFVVVGQVGGPILAGLMADATGDYQLAFIVMAILCAFGAGCFFLARKPPRPRRERRVEARAA